MKANDHRADSKYNAKTAIVYLAFQFTQELGHLTTLRSECEHAIVSQHNINSEQAIAFVGQKEMFTYANL